MERFAKSFSRLAISASVLLIFVAAVAQAQTTPKIVFHSDEGHVGNPEIYIMNADGTGTADRLTNHIADDEYAAFCGPDKIVFSSNRALHGKFDIWIMDVDGSNQVNVTNHDSNDHQPDCYADVIAFRSDRDSETDHDEIYTIKTSGLKLTRLTDNNKRDEDPHWCGTQGIIFARDLLSLPAGSECLRCSDGFVLNPGTNYQIFLMDFDGQNERALTCATNPHPMEDGVCGSETDPHVCVNSPLASLLSYFPSCKRAGLGYEIVMSAYRPAPYLERDIYSFPLCGSGCCVSEYQEATQLTNDSEVDDYPGWSPDGTEITWASKRNGGDWDIFVMDDDGSNETARTTNSDEDVDPDWGDADD